MAGGHIVVADYVAGQLSDPDRQKAERHLTDCDRCQAAVKAVRQTTAHQPPGDRISALVEFAARLVLGSVTLLALPLRRVRYNTPTGAPAAEIKRPVFEPLRVLQPRVVEGMRGALGLVGRFGLVVGLTLTVLFLPTPTGLSDQGHRALAVFVFTGSILALEPVSLPIAALMVPVAQVALGVATASEAFETFSRPVVFLILASLFLAEALRKHGLTRRLALATIVASGGGVRSLLFGLMGIAALFSMWVENTATAAVLIPVALTISNQVPDPKQARPLLVLLVLGIAYGASLGGMVTIMGSASNAVAAEFLSELRPWTFVDWMRYGLPSFLLVFPLTWLALVYMVPVAMQRLDVEPARQQVEKLGPMSPGEREILWTMSVAVILWVSGSFIEPALSLPPTLLSAAMVAVMTVAYLAIRDIINWEDIKGVSWGIFLIIGAGLSLGEVLGRTGATDWFATMIAPVVSGSPLIVSLLLLVYLSALLTNVLNNTTIAAVFVPILISLAKADPNLNAVQLVLAVALATTFGYSLPSASGRMALIAASGIVKPGEMVRYGLIVTMLSAAVLGLFFYTLAVLKWI